MTDKKHPNAYDVTRSMIEGSKDEKPDDDSLTAAEITAEDLDRAKDAFTENDTWESYNKPIWEAQDRAIAKARGKSVKITDLSHSEENCEWCGFENKPYHFCYSGKKGEGEFEYDCPSCGGGMDCIDQVGHTYRCVCCHKFAHKEVLENGIKQAGLDDEAMKMASLFGKGYVHVTKSEDSQEIQFSKVEDPTTWDITADPSKLPGDREEEAFISIECEECGSENARCWHWDDYKKHCYDCGWTHTPKKPFCMVCFLETEKCTCVEDFAPDSPIDRDQVELAWKTAEAYYRRLNQIGYRKIMEMLSRALGKDKED